MGCSGRCGAFRLESASRSGTDLNDGVDGETEELAEADAGSGEDFDAAIDRVLLVRGIDLVRTEWLKALGDGLHEFRVRHDGEEIARMFGGEVPDADGRPERVLLRVFVHFFGRRIVLLLGGYDKGEEPKARRQQREIAEARRLLAQFKERQRRERPQQGRGRG